MSSGVSQQFRAWVRAQRPWGAVAQEHGEEAIRFEMTRVYAEVRFYPFEDGSEICELRIVRKEDGTDIFFLHFMIEDLDRAEELFSEMAEALAANEWAQATRVLLCCTSGMTTQFFASKMNSSAQALGLSYECSALPYPQALATEDDYAAIMLAPQVAHLRQEMARAHPDKVVFEIPGKIFGSYDAPAAVRLLMHALRDEGALGDSPEPLDVTRRIENDYRILVITFFALRAGSRLGYRLYEKGVPILEGLIRKPKLDFRDIEDLIETMGARHVEISSLDAIGIATPGIVSGGIVQLQEYVDDGLDLGPHLSARFGVPVYVDNNCNAAAIACYVSQDKHESVMFFRQEFGHIAGGLGTVLHGHILRGHKSVAGEPKFFEHRFCYEPYAGYDDARWTAEGMFQIATNVTLASIALTAPEAVYLAVDTVDDLVGLRAELVREVGEEFVPALYLVDDYVERVYLGEMVLCARKLGRTRARRS